MDKKKRPYHDFIEEEYTTFKKGIDYQRELFKSSMHQKEYDSAVTSLENITVEITRKVISKGNKDKITRINKIFEWYRKRPFEYRKRTPEGWVTLIPENDERKVIYNLNGVYSIIMQQLNILGLI